MTKGDEAWAHAIYGGYSGYIPMSALARNTTPPQIYLQNKADGYYYDGYNFFVPDQAVFEMTVRCDGNLPQQFSVVTDMPEGTPGFFRLEPYAWNADGKSFDARITALSGGRTNLTFRIVDANTGEVVAAKDFLINSKLRPASLGTSVTYLSLDLQETASRKLTLSGGGYIPGEFAFILWAVEGNHFRVDWPGGWNGSSHEVQITGVQPGFGRAVFALVCNGTVLASREVIIQVYGPTVMIPEFRKELLSSTVPRDVHMAIAIWDGQKRPYDIRVTPDSGSFAIKDGQWDVPQYGPAKFSFTITPLAAGEGNLQFTLKDARTQAVIASANLPVVVIPKPVYLIQYDLKKGTDAPTLNLVEESGRMSDEIPRRDQFVFMGWATDPNKLTVKYANCQGSCQ